MNTAVLAQNAIYLREDPVQAQDLPSHVVALRMSLLDFDCTVPERLGIDEEEDIGKLEEIYRDWRLSYSERTLMAESLAFEKSTTEEARKLSRGKDREREWQSFFRDYFFMPLLNETKVADKDLRRTSRAKFYYDNFEHAQSRRWTLFKVPHGFQETCRQGLPEPRPDWIAFYPIYDPSMEAGDGITPMSARCRWKHVPKDSIAENFSRETLEHLALYGLEPSCANVFRSDSREPVELSDCICYPWFVVEHQKADHKVENQCHYEAANTGAAVVVMLRTLSRYAERRSADRHIPPVTAVTTVGETVRVWVAYSCNGSKSIKMDCIWKGNMTNILDVIKLRTILENLHTWAMRVLRPWISIYIDQWRARFPKPNEILKELDDEAGEMPGNSFLEILRHNSRSSLYLNLSNDDIETLKRRQEIQDRIENIRKRGEALGERLKIQLERQRSQLERDQNTSSQDWRPHQQQLQYRSVGVQTTLDKISKERKALKARYLENPARKSSNIPPSTQTHASAPIQQEITRASLENLPGPQPRRQNIFKTAMRLRWHEKFLRVKLPNVSSIELARQKPGLVPFPKLSATDSDNSSSTKSTPSLEKKSKASSLATSNLNKAPPGHSNVSDKGTPSSQFHFNPGKSSVRPLQHGPTLTFNPKNYEDAVFDFLAPEWWVPSKYKVKPEANIPSSERNDPPQDSQNLHTQMPKQDAVTTASGLRVNSPSFENHRNTHSKADDSIDESMVADNNDSNENHTGDELSSDDPGKSDDVATHDDDGSVDEGMAADDNASNENHTGDELSSNDLDDSDYVESHGEPENEGLQKMRRRKKEEDAEDEAAEESEENTEIKDKE